MENYNRDRDFEHRAKTLKNIMLVLEVAKPDLIKGCSEREISLLEKERDVILPNSYKTFLRYFGHGLGGRVMSDIDILYEDIYTSIRYEISSYENLLRDEILIEEEDPRLPKKAFVFSARYCEQFMFFDASSLVKEPPILYYMENDKEFTRVGDSVFDILESEIMHSHYCKIHTEEFKKKFNKKQAN